MLSFSQTVLKIKIFVLAGIILMLPPAGVFGAQSYEIGVITKNNLNLRPEPKMMNRPLKMLKKGTKVRIIEHLDGWLRIEHEDQVGYIRDRDEYVRIISVDALTEKKITGDLNRDIEQFKKEAENIGKKIEKGKADVLTSTREEASIAGSLNDIDLVLNKVRKRSSVFKSELMALDKKITETTNASKDLMRRINAGEDYASKRLVALYKMNWLGRINILAATQSIYELIQDKKAMERILAYDENIRRNLLEDKAKLQQLLVRLNDQKMEKLSIKAKLQKQIAINSQERAKRAELLEDIRNKKSLEMAVLEYLNQAANDLDQAVKSLSSAPDPAKQINISQKSLFVSLKGLLNMPAKGKIVSFYGPYQNAKFNVVNFRSGIEIKADRGEPIRTVCDGQIIYADWFKGYGNMIIINHGDNYYTVYAHAEELFMSKGDTVEMGEVVATVGDSGSMIGPSLHFEVRHHGKPVDPLQWIKKG